VGLAWLAHLYTATGALLAFLAATDIFEHDYRTAFFWLYLAVVVDSTDGVAARAARVSERIPWFSGAKLDDIVDYVTYVFVPALFVWRALLVPDREALARQMRQWRDCSCPPAPPLCGGSQSGRERRPICARPKSPLASRAK